LTERAESPWREPRAPEWLTVEVRELFEQQVEVLEHDRPALADADASQYNVLKFP
jgi:hypothetical protein